MGNAIVYRYDAGVSEQPHQAITPTVGALANQNVLKNAIGADNLDLGGNATGNVLNGAGLYGVAALGTFVACEGKAWAVFKVEYGGSAGTRRFRVIGQDFNTTAGFAALPGTHEPGNLGLKGDTTPALAALATGYYVGDAIVVPCLGWKQVTLLLLADEQTAVTVHAWGAAV